MEMSPLVNFFSDQTVLYQLIVRLSIAVYKFEAVLRYHGPTAEIVGRCLRRCTKQGRTGSIHRSSSTVAAGARTAIDVTGHQAASSPPLLPLPGSSDDTDLSPGESAGPYEAVEGKDVNAAN